MYAELHARSAFSFLDGASTPERLASRAAELGLGTLALTDLHDVGGAVRFAEACERHGVRPVFGAEVCLATRAPVVLLCESAAGWSALTRMITRARSKPTPAIDMDELETDGLICLSGGRDGAVERSENGLELTRGLADRFGDRFYIEVSDHELVEDVVRVGELIELADSVGVPWLVTADARYASRADKPLHDVLTCIKHQCTLDEAGDRLFPNDARHLRSPHEMAHAWRTLPQGIARTAEVAERCAFHLTRDLRATLPRYPVPEGVADADEWLERHALEGLRVRYGNPGQRHRDQLRHELALIRKLGLAGYFCIVHDIVSFARSRKILVQGRGSAANSVVCYCLGITAVDPIGLDLLFERFLSDTRSEPPDIDIDIAHHDRETVLQYVYRRFGRRHAAMVCTTVNWRGKSAVRDAARVLGFTTEIADGLARQVGHLVPSDAETDRAFTEGKGAAEILEQGGLEAAGIDGREPRVRALLHVVRGLEGLPRHRATHCGGFVLTEQPLSDIVPVEASGTPGRTIVQWDKYDLVGTGLVKLDLLGLGILTVIRDAFELVEEHRGHEVGLGSLPSRDPATFEMIRRADTIGVFQIESRTQMSVLARTKPDCFFDLAVQVALVQPGPIQGNMVQPYLRRRNGEEPVTFLHPLLEGALGCTLGIPIFQEQVMKVAVTMAGFTPAQADELRRAMGARSENPAMRSMAEDLRRGMADRGIEAETAERIVSQLAAFAHHGFPQSHAASFALLVYASAYMKRHYPVETTCALLNAQPMGFYGEGTIIMDAERHGVAIRRPDVNASDWKHLVEESSDGRLAIRLGLGLIRGMGERCRQRFESGLDQRPFRSVEQVGTATGLDRQAMHRLARAGALDSIAGDRRKALWEAMRITRRGSAPFDLVSEDPHVAPLRPPNSTHVTLTDFAAMGACPEAGGHPVGLLATRRQAEGLPRLVEVSDCRSGAITIVGMLASAQRPATANGFVFIAVEDETGLADVVVSPDTFERFHPVILRSPLMYIDGQLRRERDGSHRILAEQFRPVRALSH